MHFAALCVSCRSVKEQGTTELKIMAVGTRYEKESLGTMMAGFLAVCSRGSSICKKRLRVLPAMVLMICGWMFLVLISSATYGHEFIPVLCYHDFSPAPETCYSITPDGFNSQLEWLRENGFYGVSLGTVADAVSGCIPPLSPGAVVISIDDGWKSGYTYAAPILRKNGFTATYFIYTDFVGCSAAVSWKELRELAKNGFEIGSHTKSHPNFFTLQRKLDDHDYKQRVGEELGASRDLLERNLGQPITMFSYPYGVYDSYVESQVSQHGYRAAVTVNQGPNAQNAYLLELSRFIISRDHSLNDFEKMMKSGVLQVGAVTPPGGMHTNLPQPAVSVSIRNLSIAASSLAMRIGSDIVPAQFNPETGVYSYMPPQVLPRRPYLVTVVGEEISTKRDMYFSWLFLANRQG